MHHLIPPQKTLILGTALWGWGINRNDAYTLLETFLENGGAIIDTATNYPVNACEKDFGLALKWIADWKASNTASALSLIIKIGSVDNTGSPRCDLSANRILASASSLKDQFGEALSCIAIHWDCRKNTIEERCLIEQTVNAMSELEASGLAIGMSGITSPEIYYKANPALSDKWIIQVKENVITSLARETYQPFFPHAKYLAYGINLGGLKTEPAQKDSSIALRKIAIPHLLAEKLSDFIRSDHGFEPCPTSLNELALATAYMNTSLSGVIIGPRNVKQLVDTLDYWKKLGCVDTAKEYMLLNQLAKVIS